jgi:hypothetical protein
MFVVGCSEEWLEFDVVTRPEGEDDRSSELNEAVTSSVEPSFSLTSGFYVTTLIEAELSLPSPVGSDSPLISIVADVQCKFRSFLPSAFPLKSRCTSP